MNKKLLISLIALVLLIGTIGYFISGNGLKGTFGNFDFNNMTIKPAGTESFAGIDKLLPTPIAIPSLDSTNIAFREFQNGDKVLFRLANNSNQWKTGEIYSHMTDKTSFDVKIDGDEDVIKDLKPNQVAHFDLHPAFSSLTSGTVVIVKSGTEYHSATVDTLDKVTKKITFKKANSTGSIPGDKISNVWLAAKPIVISAPATTFEALGKFKDGHQWYTGTATLKTVNNAATYDIDYTDGEKETARSAAQVADLTKHPTTGELAVNQKIIIESPNTPGAYWDATVKSLNGPLPIPATSVTATYEDEAKDATVTIDKVWISLAGKDVKPTDTKAAEEQAIIEDLKDLDVILGKSQDPKTGDAIASFQVSTLGLKNVALYQKQEAGVSLSVKLTKGSDSSTIDVRPSELGKYPTDALNAEELKIKYNGFYIVADKPTAQMHWNFENSYSNTALISTAVKLPVLTLDKQNEKNYFNIPFGDKREYKFEFTFTYNGKEIKKQTLTFTHGAPKYLIEAYTPNTSNYNNQNGTPPTGTKEFKKFWCMNSECGGYAAGYGATGNDNDGTSYQAVRIFNDGDGVTPLDKSNEFDIIFNGMAASENAKSDLVKISGVDVGKYTKTASVYADPKEMVGFLPLPGKFITLYVPTNKFGNPSYKSQNGANVTTYGLTTNAYIKTSGKNEIVSQWPQ